MKKIINFFVRLSIIIFTFLIAKSSTDVKNAAVENNNVNKSVNLSTMALKIVEVEESLKFKAVDTRKGDLTGYAYNCPLCNGTLSCAPNYNIKDGTTTYEDYQYGTVNIVASNQKNLPCGSIVSFYSSKISEGRVLAIVLDRGVLGQDLDFLVPSEEYAISHIGRSKNLPYDVLRLGWQK